MSEGSDGRRASLVRALRYLRERVEPEAVDRLWIFPVLEWETRETGLVVVSRFSDDPESREVHTLRFRAPVGRTERPFEAVLEEEGVVPADRLPRIISGVSRRLRGDDPGEPDEVRVSGEPEAFDALLPEEPLDEPTMEAGTGEP